PENARGMLARWLLEKADAAAFDANRSLEAFRFDDYASGLYAFLWNTYCDWFIEFAKPVLNGPDGAEKEDVRGAAQHVLGLALRLLHPVMPFVTAELWEKLGYGNAVALTTTPYPEGREAAAEAGTAQVDQAIEAISAIRSARSTLNVPASAVLPLRVSGPQTEGIRAFAPQIMRLARVAEPEFVAAAAEGAGPGAFCAAMGAELFLPLAGVVDIAAERARLAKERARAEGERAKLEAKLANPGFRAKADEAVVAETEERLQEAAAEIARLDAALARIAN
ncbi:MAG: class I tRNA ligase family protein, partial [Roseococcus sp.]